MACTDNGDAQAVIFPERPAACAGPSDGRIEDVRSAQWRGLAQAVEGAAEDEDLSIWMTASETLTPSEADELVGGLTPEGVVVAYGLANGTTLKAAFTPADGRPIEALAADALERALGSQAPEDPGVSTGDVPVIAAAMVSGRPSDVASVFEAQRCRIYSASVGSESQYPPLSPAIDP